VLGGHARDAALILQKVGGGRIRQNLNCAVRILDDLFEAADVGVAGRSGRIVAALPESARSCADLVLKLHAHAFEPFDRLHGVLCQILHEFWIALVVAALHRLVIELLEAVFNALLALTLRVNGVQSTFGNVGRTAEIAEFFNDDHFLGTGLISGNGGCQTGTAATDHDDIGVIGLRAGRMLFNLLAELVHIAAGLFQALFNTAQNGKARNRSAGNRIHTQRLVLDDLVGHQFQSNLANTNRFKILGGVDLFDAVLADRDLHRDRSIVAVDGSRVGTGLERRRSRLGRFGCLQSRCCAGSKHRSQTRRTNLANTHLSSLLSEVEQTNRNV
jgi:hypothetical protein